MVELPAPDASAPEPGEYDFAEPDEEKKRQAEASLKESRLRDVEAAILSTPQGREWLWGILMGGNLYETRMALSASAFEQGYWTRDRDKSCEVARRLMRASSENFSRMHQEQDRGW